MRTQKTWDTSLCSATVLPQASYLPPGVSVPPAMKRGQQYIATVERALNCKDTDCYIMSFQRELIRSSFCKGKRVFKVNKGKNMLEITGDMDDRNYQLNFLLFILVLLR